MPAPRDDRQQLHLTLLGCAEIAADGIVLLKKITMAFDGALGTLYKHNRAIMNNTTKAALSQGIALSPHDKVIANNLTQVIDKLVSINALIEPIKGNVRILVEHTKEVAPTNTRELDKTLAACIGLNTLLTAQLDKLTFITGQLHNIGLDQAVANKLTASIDELIQKNQAFREQHLSERGLATSNDKKSENKANETPDTTNKKQFRS